VTQRVASGLRTTPIPRHLFNVEGPLCVAE